MSDNIVEYKSVSRKFGKERWDPTYNGDKVAWWDPSDLSTITATGSSVDQIDDKSGNANHMTPDSFYDPSTGTDVINGLNALDAPSGTRMRTAGPLVGRGDDFSIIGVFYPSGFWHLIGQGLQATNDYLELTTSSVLMGGGNGSFAIPNTDDGPHVIGIDFDYSEAEARGYVDGNLEGSSPIVATIGNDEFRVGLSRTLSDAFVGDLGEIIVVNDITPETRQQIEGYLAWKWRLQSNLPVGHPYKRVAPYRGDAVIPAEPPPPPAPAECQPGAANVSTCAEPVSIPEEITVTFSGLSGGLAAYNDIPITLTHNPSFTDDLYFLSSSGNCYWTASLGEGAHQVFFVTDAKPNLGAETWYVQINEWHITGGTGDNAEYLLDDFPNNGPGYDPCDPRGSITYYSGLQGVGSTCILSF